MNNSAQESGPDRSQAEGPRKGISRPHLRSAMGIGVIVVGFALLALGIYLVEIVNGLPSLEELENPHPDLSTRIFSSDGQPLDMFYVHNRSYIRFDSIPPAFVDALIATEDQKFYDHWGVNLERIIKALVKNVLSMNLAKEGASTITQQLARNLYLSQEVTISRKLREQFTAVQIERTYTKHEIIEMYANTVYFGHGAYGIQVASEIYFGKRPMDLTVDECAYLVGVLKAPENYDADQHYDRAIERRNTVLGLMTEMGYVDGGKCDQYCKKPIVFAQHKREPGIASHFVEAVRLSLAKDPKLQGYNLYRDGLVIYTTLDSRMQKYANEAVREHLEEFQKTFNHTWSWRGREGLLKSIVSRAVHESDRYKAALNDNERQKILTELTSNAAFIDSVKREAMQIEAGFVVVEPKTGFVRAMVGGNDITSGRGLNHVTQIRRQPGSSFKPFVYASALDEGMNPGSAISAGPVVYRMPGGEIWKPKGGGGGMVTLRSALKFSINTVAARLILEKTTPAKVVKLAKSMGIKSPIPELPSIALGSAEVTPYELTAAYGAFPNDGIYVEPTMILKIEDRWGHVIYQAKPEMHEVLSPRVASQMVSMMRGVVDGGTATSIRHWFNYPAAGKTGTTQDFADAWFVGYTPELVAGVWVGFDDHRIKFTGWYGQGGKAAAPVWGRFMAKVYQDDRLPYDVREFNGEPARSYDRLPYNYDREPLENSEVPEDVIGNSGDGGDNGGSEGNDKPNEPPTATDDKSGALDGGSPNKNMGQGKNP
ncbi:MAG: PBP1A family penicillin-binding protein [Bacteroidetes bacterium]|nr:PBP1A family penicillin-binding protein [Bacteroidota bacterium]